MLPRAGLRTLLAARHRVVRGAPSPRATLHHLAVAAAPRDHSTAYCLESQKRLL